MSSKNVITLLGILAAFIAGWWGLQYLDLAPQPEEGDREYAETTDLYFIDIVYPMAESSAAQKRVDGIINEEIAYFKAESVGIIDEQEAARIREQGRLYELIIEYKPYAWGEFVSYEFDIYTDTGGAHPNGFFRTITFNAAGEEIALEDLFIDGAPYLPRLSEEAYQRVLAVLEARVGGEVTPEMEEEVRLGTAPTPEALQFFYLHDGALHLLFPPYQVAAYAAGSFDIKISFSELEDILRPEIK